MTNTTKAVLRMTVTALVFSSITGVAQNESIWQKIKKNAKQQGQAAAQQGAQQAQQVQQNVQQQIPVVGGQGNQTQQQSPCGSLTGGTPGGQPYTGGPGGGAGSCGPSCFDAGPFSAAVTQMTMSQQGYWHIIRMNLQFHNASNQPLIIAYHEGSMVMVDNLGNTYQAAGGNPGAVQGMGIDRGAQTDSQFVLGPGQTGNAMFSVARSRGNESAIGTGFAYNFTIDELQTQNGAQAIQLRQYNLNFPSLAPGSTNAGFPVGSGSSVVSGGSAATTGTGRGAASSYAGATAVPTVMNTGGQPLSAGAPVTGAPVTAGTSTSTTAIRSRRQVVNTTTKAAAVGGTVAPTMPAAVGTVAPAAPATRAIVSNASAKSAVTQAKPVTPAKPIPAKAPASKQPASTAPAAGK